MIAAPLRWIALGVSGKTAWEWMELLIIPLILAVGAFYLENQVEERQEIAAERRYEQEIKIADERSKQATLDSYFEQMEELLLDRSLRSSEENSEVRSVARAITTATIQRLDAEQNDLLFRFLKESRLISGTAKFEQLFRSTDETKEKVQEYTAQLNEEIEQLAFPLLIGLDLSNADLSGVDLSSVDVSTGKFNPVILKGFIYFDVDLSSVNFSDADLSDTTLRNANLTRANLTGADLSSSNLYGVNLERAVLVEANLADTNLTSAEVTEAEFGDGIGLSEEEKLDLVRRGAIFSDGTGVTSPSIE